MKIHCRAIISKRAIVFTGNKRYRSIRVSAGFVFYGWTIARFYSFTHSFLSVIDTTLSSERLVWRERKPVICLPAGLSRSLLDQLLPPGDHRQVSHARSGRMADASSACHLLSPTFFAGVPPLLSPSNFWLPLERAAPRPFRTAVFWLSR